MNDFLQQEFLNNSVRLYLEVFGAILIALIIKRIISKYLAAVSFKFFFKAASPLRRQAFLDFVVAPLDNFLFLFLAVIAFDKLTIPVILDFKIIRQVNSGDALSAVAYAAIIISFIRLCIRLVSYVALIMEEKANLAADQTDNQLVVFFRDFFRVILFIIGILLILHFCFNYDVGNLLTGLSLVGAAIALATKESLENLIASFIIFFDKPFTTGDLVKVQNFTGNVERIGLRSTRIRTDYKTYITVPNKQMVDTIIDNISLRTQRRIDISLEIGLSATAAQLKEIIPSAEKILQQDAVENSFVYLSDTGQNAHVLTIICFTSITQSLDEFNALRSNINLEMIDLLNSKNIELAAASMDIKIKR